MRCLLHIGVEKTGTTSIQDYLRECRVDLLQKGWLVPEFTAKGAHSVLCVACADQYKDDDLCRYANVTSEPEWFGYRARLLAMLKREIADAGGISALVISSEHIQSRLRSVSELDRLKVFCNDAGVTSFRVLVYLRDPADIAASLYSTAVKYGSRAAGAPPPTNGYYRNVCHHRETLERFCAVFGEDAVVPRLYVADEFGDSGVVGDFCQAAGMDMPGAGSFATRRNPALSRTGIEVLRRLNDRVPVFVDGVANPARQKLIGLMERHFNQPPYQLDQARRLAYDTEFRASNEWVRSRYFPDRSELFPRGATEPDAQPHDLPAGEWDRISGLIGSLFKGAE